MSAGCFGSGNSEAFDDDVAAELDAVVERGLEQTAAGGLVVRVDAPAGQRTMAAGPAEVEGEEELTGDEAFRIASITKLFTATVALQLAEEGVVDLDAPVADVIPDRAAVFEHDEEVTLRRLLGHTAGLPEEPQPGFFAETWELNSVEDGEVAASSAAVADLDPLDYLGGGDALSRRVPTGRTPTSATGWRVRSSRRPQTSRWRTRTAPGFSSRGHGGDVAGLPRGAASRRAARRRP